MTETEPDPRPLVALNEALAAAQGEFPPIAKDKTAAGKAFSYRYADLAAILAAVRPALAKHGLSITQPLDEGILRTELRHSSGGVIVSRVPAPSMAEGWQAYGQGLTYLRRYTVTAILGIAAEEDADGADPDTGGGGGRRPRSKSPPVDWPEPPPVENTPEMAPLVAEVQHLFSELRDLEGQLGLTETDWPQWTRGKVGLAEGEMGGPDHYRQASKLLQAEQARLVGELAHRTLDEEARAGGG